MTSVPRPEVPFGADTICDLLRIRAERHGDREAYVFLQDGKTPQPPITYEGLNREARAIAAELVRIGAAGERAVLLYPDGPEFIPGFYGSLCAGTIAVPTFPPHPARLARTLPRLQAIVADSSARVVLTTRAILESRDLLMDQAPELGDLSWLATDDMAPAPADFEPLSVSPDSLAYLQYTSGSTGSPKGVRVTHRNLLHNEEMIQSAFHSWTTPTMVGWLPLFHDMGLIGNVLHTLYRGSSCVLMSPLAFLRRPLRWLQAISKYRADSCGGPNFAYDLCVEKTTPEQRAELDLSCWTHAYCGAEPIHGETLERFAEAFAPSGFRKEAFAPCYGLAEATLMVSGTPLGTPFAPPALDTAALERGRAVTAKGTLPARVVVGSGCTVDHMERVLIVDPDSRITCAPQGIGEIWVSSASVADGYWNRPKETEEVFGARLADTGEGPFLRTGDLGFLREGELFVTGRVKDLIIIRGRNHHPHDIERTVQTAHPVLRGGCGVAFSVEEGAGEQLVLVQEVTLGKDLDLDAVLQAMRRVVAETYDLHTHRIALVAPRAVPKTSSGKLQRRACRAALEEGSLEVIADSRAPVQGSDAVAADATPTEVTPDRNGIERWLVERVAAMLDLDPAEIDPGQPFAAYGLDSVQSVSLAGDLEEWSGVPVEPTLVWDHPTIRDVARFLARDSNAPGMHDPEPSASFEGLDRGEPVAIVGIGCRFPRASGPEELWSLLDGAVDAIGQRSAERSTKAGGAEGARALQGGFLEGVDEFDAAYFKITPKEAKAMDPQQRLLLEVSCEALEDAGIPVDGQVDQKAGVFLGISSNDYAWLQLAGGELDAYFGTGSALSIAANRISYALGLRGPSLAIDTACSSSLVAVHQACASLRGNECEAALAGGVNLILTDEVTRSLDQAGALAPDGRCKTFSEDANGYARGEGVGVVVLKRLDRALANGDRIYALIRGSAINNDGRSNGLMAPSGGAQEDVLRSAYREARLKPAEVDYVEAHGTGTQLGDPIEARALGAVMAADRDVNQPLRVGSVKTNIGHLEAAAGVAGLIKVALSLANRSIPASLHCERPSPLIPFDQLRMRVQTESEPWPETGRAARAGVSSFGFGGTNAHVVLEEAPRTSGDERQEAESDDVGVHIVPLSGHSPAALRDGVHSLRDWLDRDPAPLRDIAYTASVRRSHHEHRLAVVARSPEHLRSRLDVFAGRGVEQWAAAARRNPRVAFVFPGHGCQWAGMGTELMKREPVFRSALEECEEAFRDYVDWSLLEELARPEDRWRLDGVDMVQPAIFALEVALARLWRSWGIEPAVVVGHSMGEIAAAHAAGALDLDNAARVICERSRLVCAAAGRGGMALVELSAAALETVVEGRDGVCVAASNGPISSVLSGDSDELARIIAELERQGTFCRSVKIDYASHSPQMDPLAAELEQRLASLKPHGAAVPMLSTVTGEFCGGEELDGSYWARNLREPVRFAESMSILAGDHDVFLEVSPHPVLTPAVKSGLLAAERENARTLVSLRRDRPEEEVLLESLGELHMAGCDVDWAKLHSAGGRLLRLPTTSWQRRPYWISPSRRIQCADRVNHPFLQGRLDSYLFPGVVYEAELDPERHALLNEHHVDEIRIVPGSVLLELVLAAARMRHGADSGLCLESVELPGFVAMGPGERCQLQVLLCAPGHESGLGFEVLGRVYPPEGDPGQWSSHARGRLAKLRGGRIEVDQEFAPLQRCEPSPEASEFCVNPAWVESGLRQALQLGAGESGSDGVWEVERIARVELAAGSSGEGAMSHRVRVTDARPDRLRVDLVLVDAAERARVKLEGVELVRCEPRDVERAVMGSFRDWLHTVQWHERPMAQLVQPESPQRSLIFADEGGVGMALRSKIEAAGGTCVCVSRHEDFVELAPRHYGVRMDSEADIARLFEHGAFDRVIYLWALDVRPADAVTTAADVLRDQSLGCKSVLGLVRACLATEARPRISIATCGAEQVLPDEVSPGIAQAPIWGFGRALALEHPELWGELLDLDPAASAYTQAEVLNSLLTRDDGEDHLAVRGEKCFIARLEQTPRRRPGAMPELEEEATYLITGGLGGLGLSLARWLADRGARHLLLLGCTGTVSVEARDLLVALEKLGVEVRVEKANVSDEAELCHVLDLIEGDLPPLRGVFHLAGVLDYGPLSQQSVESFERAFEAKALGAWNLHRLTRDLDLFVMFSSLSAKFASKGMANDAAANHFLDALALHRTAQGLPALSAAWGPWRDSGLAARAGATYLRRLEAMGLSAITTDEGLETLGALIEHGAAHALVAPLDLDPYLEYAGAGDSPPALFRDLAAARGETEIETEGRSEIRERLSSMPVEECTTHVEGRIREIAAQVLGTLDAEQIQPDRMLPELGLDSLSAMEMRDLLERAIGVRLPARLLFEDPTPRQIARRAADLLREGA